MTFSAVPNAGQSLGATRDQLRTNINLLKSSLETDHVDIDLTDTGKHKFVHLKLANIPTTSASEAALFFDAVLGRGVLYYKTPSNTNTIQMTGVPPIVSADGSTFLPGANAKGGLILQWGSFDPNVSTTVTFPTAFEVGTTPFSIQLTGSAANNSTFRAAVSTGTVTNTQFIFEGTVDANWNPIYWMAIGVAR